MNRQTDQSSGVNFSMLSKFPDDIDPNVIANLAAVSADIALMIDEDGNILDISFQDKALGSYGVKSWKGKNLRDTVTVECVEKIDRLLETSKKQGRSNGIQVNHAAAGKPDLPIKYTILNDKHLPVRLVLGENLTELMLMQQRLIQTQFDLESDYRNLQENESRYRTVFQMSADPMVLIDGSKKTIIDINAAAALIVGQQTAKLIAKPVKDMFERSVEEPAIDAMSEARHGGATVNFESKLSKTGETVQVTMAPYREHGTTNLIMAFSSSGASGTEESIKNQNRSAFLETLPEPTLTIDQKGRVIQANELFLDMIQLPNKGLITGRSANNWVGASPVDLQVLMSKLKDETRIRGFSTVIKDHFSGEKQVQLSASKNTGTNEITIMVSSASATENQVALQKLGQNDDARGFADLVGRVPMKELVRESLDVIEKMCIEAALEQTRNNRASAAELLGLSRQSLYIKLRKHGLEDYRPGE